MAEEILRRVAALRLAAALAVALTLAGFTTRDTIRNVADTHGSGVVPKNSIGSQQIKNHSLLAKDFKEGAVLTPSQANQKYLKLSAWTGWWEKIGTDFATAADALEQAVLKIDANFLKLDDFDSYKSEIDNKFQKLDTTFMQGDGSVLTGMKTVVTRSSPETLLAAAGLLEVDAVLNSDGVPEVTFVNTTSSDATLVENGQGTIVKAGGSQTLPLELDQPAVVQLIGQGLIATITITGLESETGTTFAGQALVNAPAS